MASERTPLLGRAAKYPSSSRSATPPRSPQDNLRGDPIVHLDRTALLFLLMQHTSSMFGASLYSFASYIFLVIIFKDTLAPACLVGIFTKVVGLTWSGYVGGMIDRTPRLRFVRGTIAFHKVLEMLNYALFLVLLGPLDSVASPAFRFKASLKDNILVWTILSSTIIFSSLISLCGTGMEVSVERDWVMAIAQGDSGLLSRLNSYMRMIGMLSRIFPSMVVSVITYALGYWTGGLVLIALTGVSMMIEFWWIQIVYNRFPSLAAGQEHKYETSKTKVFPQEDGEADEDDPLIPSSTGVAVSEDSSTTTASNRDNHPRKSYLKRLVETVKTELEAWKEFIALPIFWASIAASVRWLDTLKMDGIGVSFFKLGKGWDDGYISLLRAGCLITSIIGTGSEPYFERWLGVKRTGVLSLVFAITTLAPAVIMFFIPSNDVWTSVIMVSGIIITRTGSTCFNLAQIKQLQITIQSHPQRNKMVSLQSALDSWFQLLRYSMTLIWSSAEMFKWTAGVTLGSHCCALGCYLYYISKGKKGEVRS